MLDLRGEPGCWAFTLDLTFRETLGFGTCKSATYWRFPSSNWDLRSIWGKQKSFTWWRWTIVEPWGSTEMHFPGKRRSLPQDDFAAEVAQRLQFERLPGWLRKWENWDVHEGHVCCRSHHCWSDIMDAYGCLIFSPIYPEASFESKVWNANVKHGQHGRWALPHRLGITLWTNQVNTAETLCTCCYPCPYQVQCKMRLASSEMLVLHRKTIHIKQRQETPWVDL